MKVKRSPPQTRHHRLNGEKTMQQATVIDRAMNLASPLKVPATDCLTETLPAVPETTPGDEARRSEYAMGYSDIFLRLLRRRSASRNAAHLLPLLRPGMSLLDLGCGPGSITLGLAQAVYPGRVTGLDRNEEQLELARRGASEDQVENARFVNGSALDLPFPDDSLDAVHCHAFLMHSPAVREQLTEIVRVLKPGGILSSRDMDVPASYIAPVHESNQGMWQMLGDVIRQEGGDPWMGRHLKTFFVNAGLVDVEAGYGADFFDSPEDVEFLKEFLLEWGLSPEFAERTSGTWENFARWRVQVEKWSQRRSAAGCFHFGHAVGRKPWKVRNAARRADPATGWGIPVRRGSGRASRCAGTA